MSGRLPQSVQPERLAETGTVLRGSVALKGMTRLAGYLHDDRGDAEVELAFGIDEQGIRYAAGRVRAELQLLCQRCLQPLTLPIDVRTRLAFVHPEEAERLPDTYDPLVYDEPSLEVARIVEDELMLALPIVPMHASDACVAKFAVGATRPPRAEGESKDARQDRRRPFAGLAELMKKQK
jgi:uncharacterized protein